MKIKQWIGVLLCTLLCVGMLPTMAFAAEGYKVLIGDTWADVDNADDVLGDGTVTYDKDTNTVTLNNTTINGTIYCETGSALNIVVNGTNTMNCGGNVSTGISNTGTHPINISGSGSLTITVEYAGGNAIRDGQVTIDGTTLELHTSGTALKGYPLTLKNGAKVTAELSENSSSVAVSGSAIEICDSTLIATSPGSNSIIGDSIKIENSTVIGTSKYPFYSKGDITIVDSTVKAETADSIGIWLKGDLLIQGNSDVTAIGSTVAFYADGSGSCTLEPPTGGSIDVFVGADKDNAAAIDDSPVSQVTDISTYGKSNKYFHSTLHQHVYDQRVASDAYKASDATCAAPARYYLSCACGAKGTETFEEGTTAGHKAGTEWKSNSTNHWNECTICGATVNEAAHNFKWVTDKEATATEAGLQHEECTVCGYAKAAVEIPATGAAANPTKPNKPGGTTGSTSPRTGDNSNIALWIVVMLAAIAALTGTALYSRKKKYNR